MRAGASTDSSDDRATLVKLVEAGGARVLNLTIAVCQFLNTELHSLDHRVMTTIGVVTKPDSYFGKLFRSRRILPSPKLRSSSQLQESSLFDHGGSVTTLH